MDMPTVALGMILGFLIGAIQFPAFGVWRRDVDDGPRTSSPLSE